MRAVCDLDRDTLLKRLHNITLGNIKNVEGLFFLRQREVFYEHTFGQPELRDGED